MVYVVKFTDLRENTRDEFTYDHLFDALSVAKHTHVGADRLHTPALSHTQFDSQLLVLLTTGMVYGGCPSDDFPNGDFMISLFHRDGDSAPETVVFNALPMPFAEINNYGEAKIKAPLPKRIPAQNAPVHGI